MAASLTAPAGVAALLALTLPAQRPHNMRMWSSNAIRRRTGRHRYTWSIIAVIKARRSYNRSHGPVGVVLVVQVVTVVWRGWTGERRIAAVARG